VTELDLRSLAVLRMGLGLVVLADLLVALTNAEVFYSDAGVLPRSLLMEKAWHHPWAWSLHAWSGSVWWQQLLLGLAIAAAIALVFGWKTRVVTIVSWVLWCSLETRNSIIVNGADPVIRLLLFWGMFLPLGRAWSLDAMQRGSGVNRITASGLPSFCLMLQIAMVYWFSALLKTDPVWNEKGLAVWQVLHADVFAKPLALWLRLFPVLCEAATHATLFLERWGPLLIFIPFAKPLFRVLAVLLFWSFHCGIYLTMDIGSFPLVMLAAWCALLPSQVWDALPRWRLHLSPALGERSVAGWLRDGFCALALLYAVMWNLRTTDFPRWEKWLSRDLNGIGFALRLDQFWTMFAPYPWLDDGWLVLPAKLVDGTEVDLLNEGLPPTMVKPTLLSARYKDARWQKYLGNLWMKSYAVHRDYLCRYLVRRWNAQNGALRQVEKWELVYMLERTRKDGKGIEPITKHILARSVPGME
jgi:hypothetical protein